MMNSVNCIHRPIRRTRGAWWLPGLALALVGCGSQIDSLDDPVVRSESEAPAGIYEGELVFGSRSTSVAVTLLINAGSSPRAIAYVGDGSLILTGVYETGERSISWNARSFEEAEVEDEETGEITTTQVIATASAQGSFDAEGAIQFGFDTSAGDFGTISADYSESRYETRSDLPLLAGTWLREDPFGAAEASFSISQSGDVFGQDVDDCSYSGSLSLIEQRYNLYRASLNISCDGTTELTSGLATLISDSESDTLEIAVSSSTVARLLVLLRN